MLSVLSLVQPDEMTDEEESAFDAAVADPTLIKTEAEAQAIIHLLDGDVEDIQAQLAAAKFEAEVCALPEHRLEWVRKACCALSWKFIRLKGVKRRLAQLTPPAPPKIVPVTSGNDETLPARIKLAELRLQEEQAIRARKADEAATKAQNIIAANSRNACQADLFVKAARKLYSIDENKKIWDRAKADYPDDPCWD